MNRDDVNLRVRDIMNQRGLTIKALAQKMNLAPAYVSNVLNGRDLSLNILLKIAGALEVKFGDLFVSSFTPNSPYENEFVAMVKCRKGIYTASNAEELQSIVNSLTQHPDANELTKRTLQRMLRFPADKDSAIITELMYNLSRSLSMTEWKTYYTNTLLDLLPADFVPDYKHLSTFLPLDEVAAFKQSLM